MESPASSAVLPLEFRQPRQLIRWLGVIVAFAGWAASLDLFLVSTRVMAKSALFDAVCGGGPDNDCTSVLTAPQAYVPFRTRTGTIQVPVSAFGMAYFACVALWYLFVGPPTHAGRWWHLVIALFVVLGVWQSLEYIRIMHSVLHRWCGGCLVAHALNGGLLLLTALAYPWHPPTRPNARHPAARLVLATLTAGALAFVLHLLVVGLAIANSLQKEHRARYEAVLNDPEYVRWDFNRQPVVTIPLDEDELFAGDPAAPDTIVVFGDFQCHACRELHLALQRVVAKYPQRLRVAFRYFPQDPECNPKPRWSAGGNVSACRAARAAEAARMIGGRDAYLAMRALLWERQDQLPTRPVAQQDAREQKLFEDWAAELGLDRAAFTTAFDGPAVAARIQRDVALGEQLGLSAMPVVYLNGKRLRNWSKLEVWDLLLGGPAPVTTQPASAPAP